MKRNAVLLGLILLCGTASAREYSYSTWTFEIPDNAIESRQDGIYGYQVGNVSYLFTPPAPMNGRRDDELIQSVINDVVGNQPKDVRAIRAVERGDGTRISTYQVATMTKAGLQLQLFMIFSRDGEWGLMLTTLPAGADHAGNDQAIDEIGQVLATVSFEPPATRKRQEAKEQELPSAPIASALPSVPWPVPRADRIVMTPAKVDFPAARKMGLEPYEDLLPDTFDCYRVTGTDDLRPMNPTPDLRVTVARNNTYSATDGKVVQVGTWQTYQEGSSRYLKFSGSLEKDRAWVNGNERGQQFVAYWQNREVVCLQGGPPADALRVEMARARIDRETFQCAQQGKTPYPLELTGSTYTTPHGSGRLRSGFKLDDRAELEASLNFTGGPFDSDDGQISEDDAGNRILDIQYSVSTGSIFARQTTTTMVARCTAKTTPKPRALYGPAKAPATGQQGGPDGFYVGYRSYMTFIGNIPTNSYALQLSYFAPNGYFIDDVVPDRLGILPDCTRTLPNGDPLCQRYEISGKTFRRQDRKGKWSKPEPFAMTPTSVQMDNEKVFRIMPLKAMPTGIFTSDKLSATGLPGNGSSGNISSYANAYQFSGGQFAWRSDSSSNTTVGNIGFEPGILASASSSRTDAGHGTYTLNGYWLTLTFSDGRIKRLFTYGRPAELSREDASMTQELNIGGTWLNHVK